MLIQRRVEFHDVQRGKAAGLGNHVHAELDFALIHAADADLPQ